MSVYGNLAGRLKAIKYSGTTKTNIDCVLAFNVKVYPPVQPPECNNLRIYQNKTNQTDFSPQNLYPIILG